MKDIVLLECLRFGYHGQANLRSVEVKLSNGNPWKETSVPSSINKVPVSSALLQVPTFVSFNGKI